MTHNNEHGRQLLAELKLLVDSFPDARRKEVVAAVRAAFADLTAACDCTAGLTCTTEGAAAARD